ncbi:amidase [Elioraea tepidiphila]|mgnify:CR=1 FL=1|jgi:amidase|uniref:amidase n=1 Tax=Elioraea tepidiphila TaxID=457934 RepID=UPI002FDAF38C
MTHLHALSALEQARLIRTRAASAREVMQSFLARLDAVNGRINAIVEVRADEALALADAADAAVKRGEALPALHGVPATIKVNADQKGYATTNGVVAYKDLIAPDDSGVVANLRASGAIPVGRTNAPCYSYRYFTDNALHGRTLNPRNPALTPGGSSGGASAALAAGIGAIAHGNDLGGSIRYPAYATGVAGIRPSLGRVPAYNPLATAERPITLQLFSVQGPLTRHIADLRAALVAMMTGPQPDPWHTPAPLAGAPVARPMRVGLATLGAAPPVAAALRLAAGWLAEAGYVVEEVTPPHWDEAAALWRALLMTDSLRFMQPLIEANGDQATKASWAAWSANVAAADEEAYAAGLARRTAILRDWHRFFRRHPLLLCPVSRETPFPIDLDLTAEGQARILRAQEPLYVFNFLGLPGAVVPTATVADNIPLGVQLVADRFREDLCLDAAEVIEARAGCPAIVDPA